MHSIFLALQSLRTQLAQALPATPGLRHFDVSFPLNDAFDPLAAGRAAMLSSVLLATAQRR